MRQNCPLHMKPTIFISRRDQSAFHFTAAVYPVILNLLKISLVQVNTVRAFGEPICIEVKQGEIVQVGAVPPLIDVRRGRFQESPDDASVCNGQFVVLFTASDGSDETKCSCYAYVSQSTRNLRSLLKEHDVSFSMPLYHSKVEENTAEDLVELSEIEKHNLGQTRAMESMTGVDNTPQSLLMFTGNRNVHALYDLLLNYRSVFTSLTGGDVPVLYSPVPFENAALSTPEVRCKQMRRVDYMSSQLKDSNMGGESRSSSAGICYSVEIRDAYIPPWVICGICNAMRSNGVDFQASFVTESSSIGLNVGLDIVSDQPSLTNADEPLQKSGNFFGIPNATLSLQKCSAFLKGLKYGDGSYTAFLSPAE